MGNNGNKYCIIRIMYFCIHIKVYGQFQQTQSNMNIPLESVLSTLWCKYLFITFVCVCETNECVQQQTTLYFSSCAIVSINLLLSWGCASVKWWNSTSLCSIKPFFGLGGQAVVRCRVSCWCESDTVFSPAETISDLYSKWAIRCFFALLAPLLPPGYVFQFARSKVRLRSPFVRMYASVCAGQVLANQKPEHNRWGAARST